jgi:hypothetical protein
MVGPVGKRSAGPFSFSASPHLPHDSFAWGAFFMRNGLPHSATGFLILALPSVNYLV